MSNIDPSEARARCTELIATAQAAIHRLSAVAWKANVVAANSIDMALLAAEGALKDLHGILVNDEDIERGGMTWSVAQPEPTP